VKNVNLKKISTEFISLIVYSSMCYLLFRLHVFFTGGSVIRTFAETQDHELSRTIMEQIGTAYIQVYFLCGLSILLGIFIAFSMGISKYSKYLFILVAALSLVMNFSRLMK